MKLSEIRVGDDYAVSVNPRQLTGFFDDDDDERFAGHLRRQMRLSHVRRHWHGYKGRVLGFETSESGRMVVRVELTAHMSQLKEWREDNQDGTWTQWQGIVVDEDGRVIDEEETLEAVIQPSQVKLEWTEAVVEREVRQLERTWGNEHLRRRYFDE